MKKEIWYYFQDGKRVAKSDTKISEETACETVDTFDYDYCIPESEIIKMKKGSIKITVKGGCVVDVKGLPSGWTYEIEDLD